MLKGMFTYIKLSIKVKKVKKWEIISCPQTYTVLGKVSHVTNCSFPKMDKVGTLSLFYKQRFINNGN